MGYPRSGPFVTRRRSLCGTRHWPVSIAVARCWTVAIATRYWLISIIVIGHRLWSISIAVAGRGQWSISTVTWHRRWSISVTRRWHWSISIAVIGHWCWSVSIAVAGRYVRARFASTAVPRLFVRPYSVCVAIYVCGSSVSAVVAVFSVRGRSKGGVPRRYVHRAGPSADVDADRKS